MEQFPCCEHKMESVGTDNLYCSICGRGVASFTRSTCLGIVDCTHDTERAIYVIFMILEVPIQNDGDLR